MAGHLESQLARSAKGASVLIILQTGSRALTFMVNQILLRYLSPELLGVSSQLELLVVTVLTFARESLRIALTRQGSPTAALSTTTRDGEKEAEVEQSPSTANSDTGTLGPQEAVNLAYIAPLLGPVLATLLGYIYLSNAPEKLTRVPYITAAVYACGASALIELMAEPCFAIASQQGLLKTRARAEATATIMRCLVSCTVAAWGSANENQLGALPFAAGQLSYALSLNFIYWSELGRSSSSTKYKLRPCLLVDKVELQEKKTGRSKYVLSIFTRPVLLLAGTLYAQSIFKHLLTQGDSFLVSIFASLESQGTYALVSNYGSLIARLLFQPIEESSRGVFGSLLGSATTTSKPTSRPLRVNLDAARGYLETVLKLYTLLSLCIVSIGPSLSPTLLRAIAGARWASSEAGEVMGAYCYYLPLLAFNGILEAFVAATATPGQLRTQSLWMMVFFAIFAASGTICLHVYDLGALGLITSNAVNMTVRIAWSWAYVNAFFKSQNRPLKFTKVLPRVEVVGSALATALSLRWTAAGSASQDFSVFDFFQSVVLSGVFAASL